MYVYVPRNLRICAISTLHRTFSESQDCVLILRLRTIVVQSQDCALQLHNLEIAQYVCAISRLRYYSAQSLLPDMHVQKPSHGYEKKWRHCVVLIYCIISCKNTRVQAIIVWISLVENKPAFLRMQSEDLLVKSEFLSRQKKKVKYRKSE